jgi:hypothetical protein
MADLQDKIKRLANLGLSGNLEEPAVAMDTQGNPRRIWTCPQLRRRFHAVN